MPNSNKNIDLDQRCRVTDHTIGPSSANGSPGQDQVAGGVQQVAGSGPDTSGALKDDDEPGRQADEPTSDERRQVVASNSSSLELGQEVITSLPLNSNRAPSGVSGVSGTKHKRETSGVERRTSDSLASNDNIKQQRKSSNGHQQRQLVTRSLARKRPRQDSKVLDPSGSLYHHWSMVVSLAFLYNFWSLSYRFAFQEIDFSTVAFWFTLDYSADFIYILDVVVNFHTGYLEDGVLQRDINKIGHHYRECTLFYLDCFCLLPLDILYLSIGFNSILRCTRLVKIYKFWACVDRTERHTNYPNVFRTVTLVHYILVIFHWNACLFHMISKNRIIDIENLYRINDNRCDDILCQYLHAFYWSTLALTTVGDLPRPRTKGEYIYVTVELFFGLFLFASVLGHVANIVTNVSAARKEFQAKLDAVKTFMRMRRVSDELQSKVIRWFDYLWMSQKSSDEDRSVACLPDRLKAEIAIHVHLDTLKRVDIFQNTEAGFLCELVLRLKPVLFSPGDYVCRKNEVGHEMYIVSRGILEVVTDEGKTVVATLKAGSYFGEISVLNVGLAGNKRTASVRSVGYSDLFCLNKQDLWDVLKNYPNAEARIRARAEERLFKLDINQQQSSRSSFGKPAAGGASPRPLNQQQSGGLVAATTTSSTGAGHRRRVCSSASCYKSTIQMCRRRLNQVAPTRHLSGCRRCTACTADNLDHLDHCLVFGCFDGPDAGNRHQELVDRELAATAPAVAAAASTMPSPAFSPLTDHLSRQNSNCSVQPIHHQHHNHHHKSRARSSLNNYRTDLFMSAASNNNEAAMVAVNRNISYTTGPLGRFAVSATALRRRDCATGTGIGGSGAGGGSRPTLKHDHQCHSSFANCSRSFDLAATTGSLRLAQRQVVGARDRWPHLAAAGGSEADDRPVCSQPPDLSHKGAAQADHQPNLTGGQEKSDDQAGRIEQIGDIVLHRSLGRQANASSSFIERENNNIPRAHLSSGASIDSLTLNGSGPNRVPFCCGALSSTTRDEGEEQQEQEGDYEDDDDDGDVDNNNPPPGAGCHLARALPRRHTRQHNGDRQQGRYLCCDQMQMQISRDPAQQQAQTQWATTYYVPAGSQFLQTTSTVHQAAPQAILQVPVLVPNTPDGRCFHMLQPATQLVATTQPATQSVSMTHLNAVQRHPVAAPPPDEQRASMPMVESRSQPLVVARMAVSSQHHCLSPSSLVRGGEFQQLGAGEPNSIQRAPESPAASQDQGRQVGGDGAQTARATDSSQDHRAEVLAACLDGSDGHDEECRIEMWPAQEQPPAEPRPAADGKDERQAI